MSEKISKAQQRAVNKYIKNNYDRIYVTMPKGYKDRLKAAADAAGVSINSYVCSAIKEKLDEK